MPELEDAHTVRGHARWKSVLTWAIVIIATPATILAGAWLGHGSYAIVSALVALYAMIPFFVQFERRRPQARELVTLSVMIALAVASRAAFAFLPNFKPMAAIIMITGIALGPSSGFLAGAIGMLVSNFIFGQGPWTPFQMLSFGLCGFVFGWLAEKGVIRRSGWTMRQRVFISLGGFVFMLLIAGPVLDTSSLMWMVSSITPESALAIYLAGVPMNAMQGIATFITLFLIGNAILGKLSRIKTKYGMMA